MDCHVQFLAAKGFHLWRVAADNFHVGFEGAEALNTHLQKTTCEAKLLTTLNW